MAESRFKIILTDLSNNKNKYKRLHLGFKKINYISSGLGRSGLALVITSWNFRLTIAHDEPKLEAISNTGNALEKKG